MIIIDLGVITNLQDLDKYILTSENGSFYCGICHQAMNQKGNLRQHIEAKHFPNGFSYQCSECTLVLGSRKALYNHKQRNHPRHWILLRLGDEVESAFCECLFINCTMCNLGNILLENLYLIIDWFRRHQKAKRSGTVHFHLWRRINVLRDLPADSK